MLKVIDRTAFLVMDRAIFNTKEGIRRGLLDVGPEIEREVVRRIKSPPKTGRYYWRGGRHHQASAPGESPANLSGALAESIGFSVSSPTQLVIGSRSNSEAAPYAARLEFGDKFLGKGSIAARPYLKPGALSKAREVEQAVVRGVARELGKIR